MSVYLYFVMEVGLKTVKTRAPTRPSERWWEARNGRVPSVPSVTAVLTGYTRPVINGRSGRG
jgi:hypothetical protein